MSAPQPFAQEGPAVACVMVTANRAHLARRAVDCFLAQHWPNRHLVIVDDGDEDYAPILAAIPDGRIHYHRIGRTTGQTLGDLRNLSLELASATGAAFVAQWDDDDWYHPDRLSRQMEPMLRGAAACCLRATLMHLDTPDFADRPYRGALPRGVPGTILHRADVRARYPSERRGEDTVFLDLFAGMEGGVVLIDGPGLFIRCFHGSNTWEASHFRSRLTNSARDMIEYWVRSLTGTVAGHRRFRLDQDEAAAFALYVAHSRALGLIA